MLFKTLRFPTSSPDLTEFLVPASHNRRYSMSTSYSQMLTVFSQELLGFDSATPSDGITDSMSSGQNQTDTPDVRLLLAHRAACVHLETCYCRGKVQRRVNNEQTPHSHWDWPQRLKGNTVCMLAKDTSLRFMSS